MAQPHRTGGSIAPRLFTDKDAPLLGDILEHKGEYQLPVIYVARALDGQEGISTEWLASRLKGAAHVLVEKDKESCAQCIALAGETPEDFGAVRIYYPAENVARKRQVIVGQEVTMQC